MRWISKCISWDLLHNNWEYNCASIVPISEYHRGKIRTFFEFVHKKSNFSLHLIAIVKDARIDDFLLTARQMTTFNRPAWLESFSFWCEKNSKCYHKSHPISIKNGIQKLQLCIVSFESKLPYFFMISGFCNEFLNWIYSIRFAWMI